VRHATRRCGALLVAGWLGAAAVQAIGPPTAEDAAGNTLPPVLRDVGIDQKIGQGLPLDAAFRDEEGRTVTLGDYFGDKPVVLVPVYYRCPMLCPLALDGMARALKVLTFVSGADYQLVVFSIAPGEGPADARKRKAETLERFGRPGGEAWHFLTGDAESIGLLTRALGFRYAYDDASGEYVHASTLVLTTPEGRISRYFYSTEPAPKDLRLGLVEASTGQLGTPADQVLLYCYRYDAATGKYTLLTMRLVRIAAAVTVLSLALFIGYMVRQEKRGARDRAARAALEGMP
jgi:protein SCO1